MRRGYSGMSLLAVFERVGRPVVPPGSGRCAPGACSAARARASRPRHARMRARAAPGIAQLPVAGSVAKRLEHERRRVPEGHGHSPATRDAHGGPRPRDHHDQVVDVVPQRVLAGPRQRPQWSSSASAGLASGRPPGSRGQAPTRNCTPDRPTGSSAHAAGSRTRPPWALTVPAAAPQRAPTGARLATSVHLRNTDIYGHRDDRIVTISLAPSRASKNQATVSNRCVLAVLGFGMFGRQLLSETSRDEKPLAGTVSASLVQCNEIELGALVGTSAHEPLHFLCALRFPLQLFLAIRTVAALVPLLQRGTEWVRPHWGRMAVAS